ncbi:molybdate ABC transporter substrate-binding protein, partial [Eggerthella lenta]
MRKRIRVVLASVCAFALVGAFALAGCSSNTEQQAGETQKPAEEQAKSESHEAVELQLFAANSLSKAMDAVQELYTQDHTWVTFKDTQYLSSGELNEQLAGGAYADVLISASKGKMDDAVEKGYVDEATRFDMFKNDLVMVAGEDSELAAKYADQSFTLDDL